MSGIRPYDLVVSHLKSMNESQLLELFFDLDDIETVERIADCAKHWVEGCEACDPIELNDAKHIDDAQRYLDIKSEQER
jgi:hypothetical protein